MPRVSICEKILSDFNKSDEGVQYWFDAMPTIVKKLDLPAVALGYAFQQIEAGHRRTLYAGIMRKYRTDPDLTWDFVDRHDITRKNFLDLYEAIFGKKIPINIISLIQEAECVRDKITHGKDWKQNEGWRAVYSALSYATAFNKHLYEKEGFYGFGPLRGVTSNRAKPLLDKNISRLVLKGLGF